MTIREPECVALKRRGAEYVGQLLAGKSKQEELEGEVVGTSSTESLA